MPPTSFAPRQRILCVDNAFAGLRGLVGLFAQPGHTVEGISDFEQALGAVAAAPAWFDLVVIGCAPAGRDRAQFAERLRRTGYRGSIAMRPAGRTLAVAGNRGGRDGRNANLTVARGAARARRRLLN